MLDLVAARLGLRAEGTDDIQHWTCPYDAAVTLPLEGLRVVALEQAVAAPLCTRHLADLGADVFVHDLGPGAVDRLGYGVEGPYRDRALNEHGDEIRRELA